MPRPSRWSRYDPDWSSDSFSDSSSDSISDSSFDSSSDDSFDSFFDRPFRTSNRAFNTNQGSSSRSLHFSVARAPRRHHTTRTSRRADRLQQVFWLVGSFLTALGSLQPEEGSRPRRVRRDRQTAPRDGPNTAREESASQRENGNNHESAVGRENEHENENENAYDDSTTEEQRDEGKDGIGTELGGEEWTDLQAEDGEHESTRPPSSTRGTVGARSQSYERRRPTANEG